MAVPRTVRYYLLRFMRLRGTPHSIALGAAIGAGVGIAPTLPLNNILTLTFTLLFRVNPIAGILGATVFSNPLTFAPQYYLSWKIGDFLLPGRLRWERMHTVIQHVKDQGIMDSLDMMRQLGWDALLVLMTGGIIIAIPVAVFTYAVAYRFSLKFRQKRRDKHLLNQRR